MESNTTGNDSKFAEKGGELITFYLCDCKYGEKKLGETYFRETRAIPTQRIVVHPLQEGKSVFFSFFNNIGVPCNLKYYSITIVNGQHKCNFSFSDPSYGEACKSVSPYPTKILDVVGNVWDKVHGPSPLIRVPF